MADPELILRTLGVRQGYIIIKEYKLNTDNNQSSGLNLGPELYPSYTPLNKQTVRQIYECTIKVYHLLQV